MESTNYELDPEISDLIDRCYAYDGRDPEELRELTEFVSSSFQAEDDEVVSMLCNELLANRFLPTIARAQLELYMVYIDQDQAMLDRLDEAEYWVNDLENIGRVTGMEDASVAMLRAQVTDLRAGIVEVDDDEEEAGTDPGEGSKKRGEKDVEPVAENTTEKPETVVVEEKSGVNTDAEAPVVAEGVAESSADVPVKHSETATDALGAESGAKDTIGDTLAGDGKRNQRTAPRVSEAQGNASSTTAVKKPTLTGAGWEPGTSTASPGKTSFPGFKRASEVTPGDLGPVMTAREKLERVRAIQKYEQDVIAMQAEEMQEAVKQDEAAAQQIAAETAGEAIKSEQTTAQQIAAEAALEDEAKRNAPKDDTASHGDDEGAATRKQVSAKETVSANVSAHCLCRLAKGCPAFG